MLRLSKAFAPILKANDGGALLNVLSVASWVNVGELAAYAAKQVRRLVARQRPA
jgi:short-subunit dehydrogenase